MSVQVKPGLLCLFVGYGFDVGNGFVSLLLANVGACIGDNLVH